jgi:hypothetical protein
MFESAKAELQPYTRDILRRAGAGAERRAEQIWPVGPHRFDALHDGEPATRTGNCRPTAPTPRAANWCAAAWPTTRSCAWWAWRPPTTSTRKDPFNPINRRISILVMNKRTEEAVLRDGGSGRIRSTCRGRRREGGAQPPVAWPRRVRRSRARDSSGGLNDKKKDFRVTRQAPAVGRVRPRPAPPERGRDRPGADHAAAGGSRRKADHQLHGDPPARSTRASSASTACWRARRRRPRKARS